MLHPRLQSSAPLGRRTAVTKSARLWREIAGVAFVQFFTLHSAMPATVRGGQVRRLNGQPFRSAGSERLRRRSSASCLSLRTPHSALPGTATAGAVAGRTRNSCSRLTLRPRVSPGFRFPVPRPLFPVPRSRFPPLPSARVSPGFLFPVFRSPACPPLAGSPLLGVIHNGVCPSVHVKTIKFGSKSIKTGSNSGQKGIKNERKSSCPS